MRVKTVTVCSGSGGVGKTLTATNLAVSLYGLNVGRILYVDGSLPLPGDGCQLMGQARVKALTDVVPLISRMTPELFASYLTVAPNGVSLLALTSNVLDSRLVTPELVQQMFQLAHQAYDLVVFDLGSVAGPLAEQVVAKTDYACVVAGATAGGLLRARYCLDLLRSLQMPMQSVVCCLNGAPDRGIAVEQVERSLGVPVIATMPTDAEAVLASQLKSTPLLLAQPRHPIARAVERVARDIATRTLRGRGQPEQEQSPDAEAIDEEEIDAIKAKIHRRLVDEIELRKTDLAFLQDPTKSQELRTRAQAKVLGLLDEEAAHVRSRAIRRRLVKEVLDEALGLGPLEDLLADDSVTEIMVNRYDQVYVERAGKLQLANARFLGPEQLRGAIERIVAPLGRRIDEKVPMVDARLRDGSRVNAIIPPLAIRGPVLTIRKFSKKLLTVSDLTGFGSMTEQIATLLGAAVKARQNIVISGGTGSGKTTLLNVLASFIPSDERIVTIEDSAELQLPQEHVVSLEARPPNIEGEGAITIRDLVRNALRMRPDRIVVGECRSGEALDMLQAMNTGHDGSLTTVHANSPPDALTRLETMALMAGLDLPSRAIRDQIASAVNLVVQQSRLQDGSRRITCIAEVTSQAERGFQTQDIFVYRQTGVAPDGRVLGQFVPTGHVPGFIESLTRRGVSVPREIFLHQDA